MNYGIIFIIASVLVIAGCSTQSGVKYSKEQLDALATCLADKGVKEYGAFWCPNCAKQAKLFGVSDKIIKERNVYIECDPRCIPDDSGKLKAACKGMVGQPEFCLDKDIQKYPTWEFSEDDLIVGTQSIAALDTKSGCGVL